MEIHRISYFWRENLRLGTTDIHFRRSHDGSYVTTSKRHLRDRRFKELLSMPIVLSKNGCMLLTKADALLKNCTIFHGEYK